MARQNRAVTADPAVPSETRRNRVFIIDDHPLVREWLANIIDGQPDLIVCGTSDGGADCMDVIQKKCADLAIVDISLKNRSGLDLIPEIKRCVSDAKVVVLTVHDSPAFARRAFIAGAGGYVVKTEVGPEICKAIRQVLKGRTYLSRGVATAP